MSSILRSVALILSFQVVRASLLPRYDVTTLQPANTTLSPVLDLNLSDVRIATAQLPEHLCSLRMEYAPGLRFAGPPLRRVMIEAFVQVIGARHVHGDEALLDEPVYVQNGNVILVAGDHQHTPIRTLTLGILEEALDWLIWFTQRRPFVMHVMILEEMDGSGPPVGEISILKADESPQNGTSDVQTS